MVIKVNEALQSLDRIKQILNKEGVIAIPTDTVYGLAVDGIDERAVEKLNEVKHRVGKPFAFFMLKSDLQNYGVITKRKIIDFFMPGPLTVILNKKKGSALAFIGEKIGVRIPQHNFVLQLLNAYRRPLAVSSANVSGQPTIASPYDIVENFTEVELVIDDGMLVSQPSTVLDLTTTPPTVMRKGTIPILAIEKVYGRKIALTGSLKFNVLFVCSGNTCRSPMAEGLFKMLVNPRWCEVLSAGTIAMGGLRAAHYARQVVREYGASIDRHKTRALDRELVDWADLILVMEYKHYESVLEVNRDAVVKTFLLREYKRKTRYTEIPDPVGKDLAAYQQAVKRMYPTLKRVAKDIQSRFRRSRS